MKTEAIIGDIVAELRRAEAKYPAWPADLIHQVAIMQEESGEAIRAALNHAYHGEPFADVLNPEYFRDGLSYLAAADREVKMPSLFDFERAVNA